MIMAKLFSKVFVPLACVGLYLLAGVLLSFESALPTYEPTLVSTHFSYDGLYLALESLIPNLAFCLLTRSRIGGVLTLLVPLGISLASGEVLRRGIESCVLHSFGSVVCDSEHQYFALDFGFAVGVAALVLLALSRSIALLRGSRSKRAPA
jgi:hypothetical protein